MKKYNIELMYYMLAYESEITSQSASEKITYSQTAATGITNYNNNNTIQLTTTKPTNKEM